MAGQADPIDRGRETLLRALREGDGYIQEQTNSGNQAAVETYFGSRGLQANKSWTRLSGGTAQPPENVTLLTYIRNSIHHPENTLNAVYTEAELRESSVAMMNLIEDGL
jgi:hypothetical protein